MGQSDSGARSVASGKRVHEVKQCLRGHTKDCWLRESFLKVPIFEASSGPAREPSLPPIESVAENGDSICCMKSAMRA